MLPHSQKPGGKNAYDKQPPPQRQIQSPNRRHWDEKNRKIRYYVEDSSSFIGSVAVVAMTAGNRLIPDLLAWIALKNVEEESDEVK